MLPFLFCSFQKSDPNEDTDILLFYSAQIGSIAVAGPISGRADAVTGTVRWLL